MARQQFGSSLRAVSGFLSKSFDPNPLRTSFISRIKTANNNRMNGHKVLEPEERLPPESHGKSKQLFLHRDLVLVVPEPSSLPPSLPVLHHTT